MLIDTWIRKHKPDVELEPFHFERRDLGPHDVLIESVQNHALRHPSGANEWGGRCSRCPRP